MKIYSIYILLIISLFTITGYAQRGKDGTKTVASNTIVNDYTILIADVTAGSTMISVANSNMNSGGYFTSGLSAGDLIFIIQMQGVNITTPDDPSYGTITVYGNCGNNEFAEVASVLNSTTIELTCALKNNYTTAGRVQVVRVPRYSSLTINSGGLLTSPNWNGSSGGVLAVEVLGNTTINSGGQVDLTGKGFRGGVLNNSSQFGVLNYRWSTSNYGAEKGEGVAGYQNDYDNISGRYCRGAAANGGGGANGHNSGGGGGANAGDINNWNGYGNPDVSNGSWINAWNMQWGGFANNVSSGGGQGGYSYSANNKDATTTGPDNTTWGGDYRRNNGGMGGHPLDYSTGRLFLGGGGGAGDENQNKGTPGGNGGGLIYILSYADVNGSGQITSNGASVPNTGSQASDGSGGGGGGGTIVVNAQGNVNGINITANGGKGGNQIIYNLFNYPNEADGPGGGGGGGYIAVSNGTPGRSASGGNNGTTDSGGLLEFPPDGATKGGNGLAYQAVTNYWPVANGVSICSGTSATLTAGIAGTVPGGVTTYWYNMPVGGTAIASGNTFTTPVLNTNTTYYVCLCPGHYRIPVIVTVDVVTALFTATTGCIGTPTVFTNSSGGNISSYNWDFGDGNSSTSQSPNYTYTSAGNYNVTLTVTDNTGCSSATSAIVTVYPKPISSFSANATSGCGAPFIVNFTNNTTNGNTYSWNFGDGNSSSQTSPVYAYSTIGSYTVTLVANSLNGCADTLIKADYVTVNPNPTADFSTSSVCVSDSASFINLSSGAANYLWSFGDGNSSTTVNPSHLYASSNTYSVTLIANSSVNCKDSITKTIIINPPPTIAFSVSDTSACDSLTVTFSNNTTGATFFNWDFGDGNTSTDTNPLHNYNSPGTYSVTLTASTGSCTSSKTYNNLIRIYETPYATIGAAKTFLCFGGCNQYTAASSASATNWNWNFPGSTTPSSTQQNPANICYIYGGVYSISLTVSNAYCSSSQTLQDYIMVDECSAPHSLFYTSDTILCSSGCIDFHNISLNALSFQWTFYGATPSSSTQASPTGICYSTTGTYTVLLVSTNNYTSDTLLMNNFIQVVNPIVPAFSQAGNSLLSSPATSYQWYYNGNPVSGATNQLYVATQSGNYSVTTIDANGCAASSQSQYVTITGIAEYANGELIYLYPNPFSETLSLMIATVQTGQAKLKMTDAIGKTIFEKDIKLAQNPYKTSFDFSELASGVYSISVETEKGITVKKVIKQ